MPEKTVRAELIAHTPLPETVCALAAKLCYSKDDVDVLYDKVSAKDQSAFLDKIMLSKHLSTLEHATFTFAIDGVSRALLAQITRHRIASFSVRSQRYVPMTDFSYIIPPSIKALGERAVEEYDRQMQCMQTWYTQWVHLLGDNGESSNEDARFVLPNACETQLIVTMNTRELLHFFELRCCNRAQWEIRALANAMLEECKKAAPTLFKNAGPSCVRGLCPEGKKSCGKTMEMRTKHLSQDHLCEEV